MDCQKKLLKLHTIDLLEHEAAMPDALFCEEAYDARMSSSRLCSHGYVQVCMILEGNGIHRVFDQAIPCKAGDVFIAPPDTPHLYFPAREGECLAVTQILFDPKDWFEGEVASVGESRFCYGVFNDNAVIAYAMFNEQMQKEVDALLGSIECEITEKRPEWREIVRAYLTQMLISVGRYVNCSIKNDTPISSKDWNLVLSVMRMSKESYSDCGFTLESISDALYISKSHLSRIFKGLTGQLFSEYLRDIRIHNACKLLSETNLTVEEIVEKCGLRDVPSFYHNFNLRMHMTPRQYRQQLAEKRENAEAGGSVEHLLAELSESLQKGKGADVKELVRTALSRGVSPMRILSEGMLAGMSVIGERFKNNEVYVPEVLVAARAMNMGAQELKPYLASSDFPVKGRVCIGTVQGDLHDIGKNLVRMMIEGKGIEVVDLGVDVAPETFVRAAIERDCCVICCSAILTTTINVMGEVVKAAEAAGIRDRVRIMIGGAPVTHEFCRLIGADCYTPDAASAADAAEAYCREWIENGCYQRDKE